MGITYLDDAPAPAGKIRYLDEPEQSTAEFIGRETIRPLLKSAADVVGFIPDVATDVANLVPESILGPKVQRPSEYLRGKIDEYIPKAKGASEGLEEAAAAAPMIAGGLAAVPKVAGGIGRVAAREFSQDLMPAAQKAWSGVKEHLGNLAQSTKGRAEAERIASEQDIEGRYTRSVLDAHEKAVAARAEEVARARSVVKETHKDIDVLRGRIPNPAKDVPEARASAQLMEPTNNPGERLRADLSEIHSGELAARKDADVYGQWDQRLDELDKENPFATSEEGSNFQKYLDTVINPPKEGGVIKQSKRFENLARRVKAQIAGRHYSESRLTLGPYGSPTIEKVEKERPRFGRAINEMLVELRNEQWSNFHKGKTAASNRYKGMADKLETAMTEWAGTEYPSDRWAKMSERLNQLNTPRVQKTLKMVGDEHLPASKKTWGTNSSELMDMWFKGPDSANELKNALGEEKFSAYAEEHLSRKIQAMEPKKVWEFLNSEQGKWVDQVPGLRNKAEKYADEIARRSGLREDIEASIKGHRKALDDLSKQVQSALKSAPKAKESAISEAGKVKIEALTGVTKARQASEAGANALSNFMIGKTPKTALADFDKLATNLQKSGAFSQQQIYDLRVKLEQAASIQNSSDRFRAIRKWAYGVFLGGAVAGETIKGAKILYGDRE